MSLLQDDIAPAFSAFLRDVSISSEQFARSFQRSSLKLKEQVSKSNSPLFAAQSKAILQLERSVTGVARVFSDFSRAILVNCAESLEELLAKHAQETRNFVRDMAKLDADVFEKKNAVLSARAKLTQAANHVDRSLAAVVATGKAGLIDGTVDKINPLFYNLAPAAQDLEKARELSKNTSFQLNESLDSREENGKKITAVFISAKESFIAQLFQIVHELVDRFSDCGKKTLESFSIDHATIGTGVEDVQSLKNQIDIPFSRKNYEELSRFIDCKLTVNIPVDLKGFVAQFRKKSDRLRVTQIPQSANLSSQNNSTEKISNSNSIFSDFSIEKESEFIDPIMISKIELSLSPLFEKRSFGEREIAEREIVGKDVKKREIKEREMIIEGEIKEREIKEREIIKGEVKEREIKEREIEEREITEGEIKGERSVDEERSMEEIDLTAEERSERERSSTQRETSPQERDHSYDEIISLVSTSKPARESLCIFLNKRRQNSVLSLSLSLSILSQIISSAIESAVRESEFGIISNLLNMASTFSCEEKNEILLEKLKKFEILSNERLWENLFMEAVQGEQRRINAIKYPQKGPNLSDNISSDLSTVLNPLSLSPPLSLERERDHQREREHQRERDHHGVKFLQNEEEIEELPSIVLSKLVPFVFGMIDFGAKEKTVKNFVERICAAHKIDKSDSDMILSQLSIALNGPKKKENLDISEEYLEISRFNGNFEERMSLCRHLKEVGNNLFNEKQYAEAYQQFNKAILLLTSADAVAQQIGISERKRSQALAIGCHNNAALCAINDHRPDAALSHCEKALEIDPTNAKAIYRKGIALSRSGKIIHSIPVLSEAKKLHLNDLNIEKEIERVNLLTRLGRIVLELSWLKN